MSDTGSPDSNLHPKMANLHPKMASRVVSLFNAGHFDNAVLDAFKVIEELLRDITGKRDASRADLLKESLNPNTGALQDPRAWQFEREGMYKFFDGAFLAFRNPLAHRFVDLSKEEALDQIVLANRMLLMIEEGRRRSQLQIAPTLPQQVLKFQQGLSGGKVFVLDANNDGQLEILVQSYENDQLFNVYENAETSTQNVQVERVGMFYETLDILLADVDNDGQQEIVCHVGWTSESGLLFYKYRNGRYEILKKDVQAISEYDDEHLFISSHVTDVNGDGQSEVVSEPWRTVPEDLLPPDHTPGSYDQGRTRYTWKWNERERCFKLLYRELLYVGGR